MEKKKVMNQLYKSQLIEQFPEKSLINVWHNFYQNEKFSKLISDQDVFHEIVRIRNQDASSWYKEKLKKSTFPTKQFTNYDFADKEVKVLSECLFNSIFTWVCDCRRG